MFLVRAKCIKSLKEDRPWEHATPGWEGIFPPLKLHPRGELKVTGGMLIFGGTRFPPGGGGVGGYGRLESFKKPTTYVCQGMSDDDCI